MTRIGDLLVPAREQRCRSRCVAYHRDQYRGRHRATARRGCDAWLVVRIAKQLTPDAFMSGALGASRVTRVVMCAGGR